MHTLEPLLQQLADGRFYSEKELENLLHLSPSAIGKQIQTLKEWGLTIDAIEGYGYRVTDGVELLNKQAIISKLSQSVQRRLNSLEIFLHIPSTNRYLTDKVPLSMGDICLAEMQTEGQGRRGQSWYSPFGHNIYLSMTWEFSKGVSALSGLSLAVGVMVVDALAMLGIGKIGLKWPNDLVVGEMKLGGILIELWGDLAGPCITVIGLGLNVRFPSDRVPPIDRPVVDLVSLTGRAVPRNTLVVNLLEALWLGLTDFAENGFLCFADRYKAKDILFERPVQVETPHQMMDGIAIGVTERGDLKILNHNGRIQTFNSAEVSVRTQRITLA